MFVKSATPNNGFSTSLRRLLASMLLITPCAATADNHRPSAGEYEVTTVSNFNDVPVTMTTTNCVSKEDLDQDPAKIFADSAASEDCKLESFEMAEGTMSMHMVCAADDGSIIMHTEGAYTASSYSMNSTITISAGGTEISTEASVQGTRIGDC